MPDKNNSGENNSKKYFDRLLGDHSKLSVIPNLDEVNHSWMEGGKKGLGEADAFIESLFCGRTLLSILPSLVFLFSSGILMYQFAFKPYHRHVPFMEKVIKVGYK